MSISAVERSLPNAIGLEASGDTLYVKLSDGSTVSIPLDRYPRLAYATTHERANWRLIGEGQGIHWQDIDEDISVEGMLAGKRSRESMRSFLKWLMANRQPKFRPWKGEGYGRANELGLPTRLLVLGESHYNDLKGEDRKDWERYFDGQPTVGVIREYCEEGGRPFFTKFVRTILGREASTATREERTRFFNTIAFCNFIQGSVGEAHDKRPTREMWEEAAAPFRATLEWLRPTHILACGMRLWRNMPHDEDFWTPLSDTLIGWLDSVKLPTPRRPEKILGCYSHSKGQSVVMAIHHPSWKRYQPHAWHPVVKRFLSYDGFRNN